MDADGPTRDQNRRQDPDQATSLRQLITQIKLALGALGTGEKLLFRVALRQLRRSLMVAVPGLLLGLALLVGAVGQAGHALADGFLQAGWPASMAHLGATLMLLSLAALMFWVVCNGISQARSAIHRVVKSLSADLHLLFHPFRRKDQSDDTE